LVKKSGERVNQGIDNFAHATLHPGAWRVLETRILGEGNIVSNDACSPAAMASKSPSFIHLVFIDLLN
jgi:hypothetical protein